MESFSAAGQANRDAACVYVECTENTSQRINRRVEVFGPMPQPLGVQQWVYFFFFPALTLFTSRIFMYPNFFQPFASPHCRWRHLWGHWMNRHLLFETKILQCLIFEELEISTKVSQQSSSLPREEWKAISLLSRTVLQRRRKSLFLFVLEEKSTASAMKYSLDNLCSSSIWTPKAVTPMSLKWLPVMWMQAPPPSPIVAPLWRRTCIWIAPNQVKRVPARRRYLGQTSYFFLALVKK